jgi:hypothetical protein
MNNISPIDECLKSFRGVAFLGYEVSGDSTLILVEDFDVEGSEKLVQS